MTGLTRDEVCQINRRMIEQFGGNYNEGVRNVMNPNSLDFAIDQLEPELEGETVPTAVARLAFRIISHHVFFDGTKRTGMTAALWVLRANGFEIDVSEQEIIAAGVGIADGSWSLDRTCSFFDGIARPL